jgi:hypothetical protein
MRRDEQDDPFVEIDKVIDLYFLLQVKTDLLNITTNVGKGRYWFSNLQENGAYQQNMNISIANELPETGNQQQMFNFPVGTVDDITLKRIYAGTGWTPVNTIPVDAVSGAAKVIIEEPGLYQIEKSLTAGGKESMKMIFSDELMKQRNNWSILHLQVKPGDDDMVYTITLDTRKSRWQYYLIEPFDRGGSVVNADKLTISYSASPTSRYPTNMGIQKKLPANYSPAEKDYINGLKAGGKIKEVYLFESQADLQILDGEQPEVKLNKEGGGVLGRIAVPDRSMKNTTIIYKL